MGGVRNNQKGIHGIKLLLLLKKNINNKKNNI